MLPFHLRLGPFALGPMEIFIFLGVALMAALARRGMAPLGVTWGGLFDLALAGLVGGAVGARLFYFVPLWLRGEAPAGTLVSGWSDGSGFYGGLVLGSLAVALLARVRGLPVRRLFDAGAPGLPVAFAVGKLGCFFAGCCYGARRDGFPGMAFAPGSLAYRTQLEQKEIGAGAPASLPVHPTQLYEMAFGLALFGFLAWLARRSKRPGEVFLAYVGAYSAWRFGIEFLRDDPGRRAFGASSLTDSQITALVLLAAAAVAWVALRKRASVGPDVKDPARSQ